MILICNKKIKYYNYECSGNKLTQINQEKQGESEGRLGAVDPWLLDFGPLANSNHRYWSGIPQ